MDEAVRIANKLIDKAFKDAEAEHFKVSKKRTEHGITPLWGDDSIRPYLAQSLAKFITTYGNQRHDEGVEAAAKVALKMHGTKPASEKDKHLIRLVAKCIAVDIRQLKQPKQ